MIPDEDQEQFIAHLLSLAIDGKEKRGELAELRSGLGKDMEEMTRVHKHVVPYRPNPSDDDRWYYVTATLFGMHPKHKKPVQHTSKGRTWTDVWTIGRALRQVRMEKYKDKPDSLDARFVALLNAHPDDLDDHLRQLVSLLKSNEEQPLDWSQLLEDLIRWNDRGRPVQLRWARDYYREDRSKQPRSESAISGDNTTEQEENDRD